jgi:TonB family protein
MVNNSILRLGTTGYHTSGQSGAATASENDSQTAKTSTITDATTPSTSASNVAPNEVPKSLRNVALTLVLSEIAHQVRASTASTGSVILIIDGGVPVYGASSGAMAREVSRYFSGCSAFSWQSGTLTVCEDSETDSRFDPASLRRLGVRSFVILPVQDANNAVIAILEIFSSRFRAFSERDHPGLHGLGRRIADHIELADRTLSFEENIKPAPRKKSVPVQAVMDRYELWFNRLRVAVAGESWNFLLGTITISLAILVGWMMGRGERESAAHTTAPGAKTAIIRPQAAVTPTAPKTGNAVLQTSPASAEPRERKAVEKESRRNHRYSAHSEPRVVASNDTPDALLIIENGEQTPPSNSPSSKSNNLRSSTWGENAASDAKDHEPAVSVSEGIANQHLLERVEPDYPESIREQHLQGTVILGIHVTKNGTVRSLSCLEGDSQLCLLAAKAVRQWKFSPLLHNGAPASFESEISMEFALP